MSEPMSEAMRALNEEKWLYSKFWNLLHDPQLMRVFEKFGPAAFRRSSVLEGFEQFVKAQQFGGRCAVEIGSFRGLTAIVLARHFDVVHSFDIFNEPMKYEIVDFLGISNVNFVHVADNAEKAARIRALQFDGAYADGDHTNDAVDDFDLVRGCGAVLIHEYWEAQPAVVDLVHSLDGEHVVTGGKFALWRDRVNGAQRGER